MEPYPGSPEYEAADAQARNIVGQEDAEGTGSQGEPQIEPPPGSPEHQAAEAEARKLDTDACEKLGFFGQLGVAFKRIAAPSKKTGTTFEIDSRVRRQEILVAEG